MVMYQGGDYKAFETLYLKYSGQIYGYLKKRLPSGAGAEDLLQQTFLHLHEYRARYNSDYPFLPWLFAIVRNLHTDHLRKKTPTPMEGDDIEAMLPATEPPTYDSVEGLQLKEALSALPVREQQLIQMRFENGLSFEEISSSLGLNAVSVRKRVSRALGKAKKLVLDIRRKKGIKG